MSSFENELGEPDMPKGQDFSALGYDASLGEQIAADIAPDNPDRYENAATWVEVLLEDAQGVLPERPGWITHGTGLDGEEFREHRSSGEKIPLNPDAFSVYLKTSVISQLAEETTERKLLRQLNKAMTEKAVVQRRSQFQDLPDGGFMSESFAELAFPAYAVGDYVGRRIEYLDIVKAAKLNVTKLVTEAAGLPPADVLQIADALDAAECRIGEIQSERLYGVSSSESNEGAEEFGWDYYHTSNIYDGLGTPVITRDAEYSLEVKMPVAAAMARKSGELRSAIAGLVAQIDPEVVAVEKYGAKGANLLRLQQVLDGLDAQNHTLADVVKIPAFMIVDTDAFREWRDTGNLLDASAAITEWIAQNGVDARYTARSSAVRSEDGEHMGAGVYDSVLLPDGATTSEVADALTQIYESVDAERAKAYQEQTGIANEEMAVVVQEFADCEQGSGLSYLATVNTTLPHQPRLAEYKVEHDVHPLQRLTPREGSWHTLPLDRNGVALEFGSGLKNDLHAPRFHVPPDTRFHHADYIWAASQAAMFGEVVLGTPVQVEVVLDEYGDYAHLVQARPLPAALLEPVIFEGFPDEEPWFAGRSVGVFSGVEGVITEDYYVSQISKKLRDGDDNWVIKITQSYAKGRMADRLSELLVSLPEAERNRVSFLIELPPDGSTGFSGYGHMETMAAELGVNLLFADPHGKGKGSWFAEGQKVTLYSNGFEGRIYSSDEARETADSDRVAKEAALNAIMENDLWGSDDVKSLRDGTGVDF